MPEHNGREQTGRNWFDAGGQDYARFRPTYPPELAGTLAALAPARDLAVDIGCGTGQLTVQLAGVFDAVLGADPSGDQLANADPHDRVRYVQASAEDLPVDDGSASLVTAAQAAHWFDLPAFYREARRIAAPGAVLALISYGVPSLEPGVDERFQRFYWREIGPYWPAQRRLVEEGYRTIDFPLEEISVARIGYERQLTLGELLGYISTWSAVRAATEAGRQGFLTAFAEDLAQLWGDPEAARRVGWPVNMRVGVV